MQLVFPDDDHGLLPDRLSDRLPVRIIKKAERASAEAALAAYYHHLDARVKAECVEADIQAVGDVSRTAVNEEMGVFDSGMARAAGSATKTEMVARAVQRTAAIVDRRINRAFGG